MEKDRCLYVPSVWRDEALWQLCLFGWHYLYISPALCAYNAVECTTWIDKRLEMLHILSSPRLHPLKFLLKNSQRCEEKQIYLFFINAKGWSVRLCVSASRNVLLVRTLACVLERIQQYMPVWMCVCVRVWTCMRVTMLECAALSCLIHSMWEGLLRGRPSVVFWRSTCCKMRLESVETQLVKSWHIMRQTGVKAGKRFRDKQLD